MSGAGPLLVITPSAGAVPIRKRVTRMLTTIGSDSGADLRLATVPARWVVVQRQGESSLIVRNLATGVARELGDGDSVTIDDVILAVEAENSVARRRGAHQLLDLLITGARNQ